MKIVFNPVPTEFIQGDETFIGTNGRPYYYQLEVDSEGAGEGTFSIQDGCGRFMPFDFTSIDDLVVVLSTLRANIMAEKAHTEFWNKVWSNE